MATATKILCRCPKRRKRKALSVKRPCVLPEGLHTPYLIEVNERCQLVRADKQPLDPVRMCDVCSGVRKRG